MSSLLSSRPSLFSLRVVATGKSRRQGDGSDRAHRRRLPMAAVPHDTAVSGVVEVSNNTDRRVSVRNVERAHVKPALVTSQLTRAKRDQKPQIICPLAHSDLAKLRGPFPGRLRAQLAENTGAHTPGRPRPSPAGPTRSGDGTEHLYGLVTGGGERLRAAGPATGNRPPLRRGRSRSAYVVNGRLRHAGEGAVRSAPPCVVDRVRFYVLYTSSACARAVRRTRPADYMDGRPR